MSMHHEALVPEGFDPWRRFIENVPEMVEEARTVRENEAHSYRGFKVGAAIFAWTEGTIRVDTMARANTKVNGGKEKVCAEPKLLDVAQEEGFNHAIGLVVVATSDQKKIKGVNHFAAPTLHPCVTCQGIFLDNPLVRDETILITAGAEHDIYQVHSFSEINGMYFDGSVESEQRVHQEGFGRAWSRKLPLYDALMVAEHTLPIEEQRSRATLAKMAMATAA